MVQTLCLSSGKPCTSSTCVGLLVASCPNRPIPPRIEKQFIPLASGRHRSKKDSTNQAKRPSIRPSDDPTEPETSPSPPPLLPLLPLWPGGSVVRSSGPHHPGRRYRCTCRRRPQRWECTCPTPSTSARPGAACVLRA